MNILQRLFRKIAKPNIWARPKMKVIFRAEIMPGKSKEERTYTVKEVLSNGRVVLNGFIGEHRESEFEPIAFS